MTETNTAVQHAVNPKVKISAKVVKTTLAGALLDIGQELPGVLHISQIQKEPVNKVEDVLKPGQVVEVWVKKLKKDRVEMTMIEPLGLEWNEILPDQVVRGKVVRVEAYGAFVDFGAERPGMVHVSELSRNYVKLPGEVVKEGQEVEAVVLDVDRKKKQIRLSMKALMPELVEEEKPARENREGRKDKPRRAKKEIETLELVEESPKEPELTGMQIAWQSAMDRSGTKAKTVKVKPGKFASGEQADILLRTLEKRQPTGG